MSKLKSNSNNEDSRPPETLQSVPVEVDEWFELEELQGGASKPRHKLGMDRRHARGVALQTLFESDAVNHEPRLIVERHIEFDGLSDESASFLRLLVNGVVEKRNDLDDLIQNAAPSWPMDQMAKVDKNILRLAIFEILFNNDVPRKAAINEAIELAKNFGSDSSSRFVNGVLGAVIQQIDGRKEQPA